MFVNGREKCLSFTLIKCWKVYGPHKKVNCRRKRESQQTVFEPIVIDPAIRSVSVSLSHNILKTIIFPLTMLFIEEDYF